MLEIEARAILDTPVGLVAIAASHKGIASIDFVSQKAKLSNFSNAKAAEQIVQRASKQLDEYFLGQRKEFDLPLDLSGTKFQMSVWKQILKIGFGKTSTYGEIARSISNPRASRAVGGAVGANPIPIIIGCHRIMGSTGKLTGYSGGSGIPTKKKLLALEGIEYK